MLTALVILIHILKDVARWPFTSPLCSPEERGCNGRDASLLVYPTQYPSSELLQNILEPRDFLAQERVWGEEAGKEVKPNEREPLGTRLGPLNVLIQPEAVTPSQDLTKKIKRFYCIQLCLFASCSFLKEKTSGFQGGCRMSLKLKPLSSPVNIIEFFYCCYLWLRPNHSLLVVAHYISDKVCI